MQRTGLIWLLFGYQRRISRSQFWMGPAIYLGGLLVSLILSAVFSRLLFVTFFAGLVVSSLMVCIKRLHDRNKGDWWAILFFMVPIALNGRINGWSLGGQLGETADIIFHLVATAISIWAFIELGCLRGTPGHECLWHRSTRRPATARLNLATTRTQVSRAGRLAGCRAQRRIWRHAPMH